jgi:PAS domain S-box-containing protein
MSKLYNVLLVEDNASDANLIRELMPENGPMVFHLDYAVRLSSALTLIREKTFDIILLDIGLPDSFGIDTLRTMRKNALNTPIVVLTGTDDEKTGLAAIQEGAQDYVVKGQFGKNLLSRILCYAIERHQNTLLIIQSEKFLRATLDALSSNIAILDDKGVILEINKSWREFAENNDVLAGKGREGINYLQVCLNDKEGKKFADGLREVLSGERNFFEMEYPCHSPNEQRWFNGTVTRFKAGETFRIVVAHENITKRKLAEETLAHEQYLMQTLMNNIPDHIYFKDRNCRFLRISKSHADSFGLKECSDAVGKSDFDYFSPEHANQAYLDEQEIMKTKQILVKEEKETWIGNPESWVSTTKLPLCDIHETVIGTFGISRDITEQKMNEAAVLKSLREKEILLKEIHHRVKNNLQIILSFISLQKHNNIIKDPIDMINTIENRIRSIAIVHELVYQSNSVSEIDIKKYITILINQILGQFGLSKTISYTINAQNLFFDINLMVPFGIILNELTTNVAKHAFKDNHGEITISITKSDDTYTMIFHDNGMGINDSIDITQSETLGTNIMFSLAHQIDGNLKIENDHGLKAIFTFKDTRLVTYSNIAEYM